MRHRRWALCSWLFSALMLGGAGARCARAAEVADALKLLRAGQYEECIAECRKAIDARQWDEGWWRVRIQAELATGKYAEALKSFSEGMNRPEASLALHLLGYDVHRVNDQPQQAEAVLARIREQAARAPWRYSDAPSRVALGKALLLAGADARQVLELFYDRAKKESPQAVEPYVASGQLALEKFDYALAAESFEAAVKRAPDDPDVYFGLAQAYEDDPKRAIAALEKAMELNPRHAGGLLLQVDNLIDREEFKQAHELLAQILEINPRHPGAWAYRAVLAHLAGDKTLEESHRAEALSSWRTNPEVDYLIGTKLSAKYRFTEGEAYQRKALANDPRFRKSKAQLCQDLLRLGKEEEGWRLADEVFREDRYNVIAYNLVTLHDHISKYSALEGDGFLVRMEQKEAQIYGPRVLRLLSNGKKVLAEKYGIELPEKIIVEIFPQQKDFAIRTFGLPGGAGFLGVCFGPVVTMNSPASQGARPSNWEAVLWHEFCHVITLAKTRNKMPRWLSEGISVYEERQKNPSWGQVMNPQYRELILKGEGIPPVSKLSGAFLQPPTPMHLQFAYYESSMVVEYVVERWGISAIKNVLDDLAKDVSINDTLAKHTEPIEKLDESFAAWLKGKAEGLASGVDWERPESLDADSAAMAAWNRDHPNSFWGLLGEGRALLAEQKWEAAKVPLKKAAELYPSYGEAGGPWLLLAVAHRNLKETQLEREMLAKHVALNADAIEPRLRLMELAAGKMDWPAVRAVAEEVLGINPLVSGPHRYLAQAAEATAERATAIEAHRTLLMLDPLDKADHHHRLARLLIDEDQLAEAKLEAIKSLEEAPRFRAAHQTLLEVVAKMGTGAAPPTPTPPTSTPPTSTPPTSTPPTSTPPTSTPPRPTHSTQPTTRPVLPQPR